MKALQWTSVTSVSFRFPSTWYCTCYTFFVDLDFFLHLYMFINEWDQILSGRRDRMVVVFITTYAIGAYHHWCEFESRSGRGVQHYVIKFVSDLRQVSGFLRVLWFPPPIKLTAMIYLYIVESAVKHHKTKPNFEIVYYIDVLQNPNTLYIQIYNVDILTTPCTSAYPDLLTCIGPIRFFVCMLYNTVHVHLVAFTLKLLLLHHTCDYMIHIRNI